MTSNKKTKSSIKAFTLIELLVVIAIIGLLSSVVIASLNITRAKSRDSKRRQDMVQLRQANELRYLQTGSYAGTAGYFTNLNHGGLDTSLAPQYIPRISDDPQNPTNKYIYWRKDYSEPNCVAPYTINPAHLNINKAAFYAKLERPTASDLATITGGDSLDLCIYRIYGYNFKAGN